VASQGTPSRHDYLRSLTEPSRISILQVGGEHKKSEKYQEDALELKFAGHLIDTLTCGIVIVR